jgi:multidrug efflux pump subunit AcrA (membrane-fusion protein)
VLVTVGDHVKAGQHLVRVECSNIEHELQARKSDLAAAEAGIFASIAWTPTRGNQHRGRERQPCRREITRGR